MHIYEINFGVKEKDDEVVIWKMSEKASIKRCIKNIKNEIETEKLKQELKQLEEELAELKK